MKEVDCIDKVVFVWKSIHIMISRGGSLMSTAKAAGTIRITPREWLETFPLDVWHPAQDFLRIVSKKNKKHREALRRWLYEHAGDDLGYRVHPYSGLFQRISGVVVPKRRLKAQKHAEVVDWASLNTVQKGKLRRRIWDGYFEDEVVCTGSFPFALFGCTRRSGADWLVRWYRHGLLERVGLAGQGLYRRAWPADKDPAYEPPNISGEVRRLAGSIDWGPLCQTEIGRKRRMLWDMLFGAGVAHISVIPFALFGFETYSQMADGWLQDCVERGSMRHVGLRRSGLYRRGWTWAERAIYEPILLTGEQVALAKTYRWDAADQKVAERRRALWDALYGDKVVSTAWFHFELFGFPSRENATIWINRWANKRSFFQKVGKGKTGLYRRNW